MIMDVFDDAPGNRESIIGGGAAPDLIQDQQAAGGGVMQDVGGFDHFHHECGLPRMDLVLGADAGEDPVNETHSGRVGGYKGTDLRHQDDQGGLAQVGRFSTDRKSTRLNSSHA